ncbi:D-2-hydroxyacid dehydrogenase [Cohnella lubricantis]|uniref:D-2-hydroxyacid dehydrogenase n=1 Tax=Cohnella lubricantis TaxID=2163172 RepID=A0A841TCU1_9BACL|nr:D-2-hydroxyacid dehydrogenase [Cohnella lubricantis]MBB6679124.1 D-2-hydroxyacid dehydrogenase [Cohnella lubricantis]MBP2120183.1 glycerate dehydrogenase [Cohnella lubricantis]
MRIVVLDGYVLNPGDLSWDSLEELGDVVVHGRTPADQIVERSQGAEILLTNKTPLRAETLAKLPDLKYIGVLATGYDVVDVEAAKRQGIIVTNVPAYGNESVAQFVFALLLELCSRVGLHSESVRQGDWSRSPEFSYWRTPLVELSGKTIGIVGLGRIGRRAAQLADAFGMKVIAAGRPGSAIASSVSGTVDSGNYAEPSAPAGQSGIASDNDAPFIRRVDLATLLRESDVVSLHCPLTADTEGMIGREALALMKPTAFLVNTARGKLIAEADLAAALNEGRIGGAALDVLSAEPPSSDNPLLTARNCMITPHIAWASLEARTRLLGIAVDNVARFLSGSSVNVVNG